MSDPTSAPAAAAAGFLRTVDFAAAAARPLSERFTQRLIDVDSGATSCVISYIRTPPGGGSPRGLHTHEVDQHFYVLEGEMGIRIRDDEFVAGPGTLVYFPAGVPHQNWNVGTGVTVHLAINSPLPPADAPREQPVR
jgi:mannose-6-phosphate isomerase-like protein (cupin superfamily)